MSSRLIVQDELAQLENAAAEELLAWGLQRFGDRLAICTSFQTEGMVILDMASGLNRGFRVFTIDTGRMPPQTGEMIAAIRRRYGIEVEVLTPDSREVETMVGLHGPNLFYQGVPQRMLCCEIRKVRPLARKLQSMDAWVTGLRRQQNVTRAEVRKMEIDPEHGGIVKLNPLADWSDEQVEAYTRQHDLPRHPLYAQGYTSIGCAPCTRPTRPGEHPRAGRWWWETGIPKECGVHISADGRVERDVDVLLKEIVRVSSLSS